MKPGWQQLLTAAARETALFRAAWEQPAATQEAWLLRLLRDNAATDFGREHGFAKLRSIEAFRSAVPVRDYEAFARWIGRIARGEPDVLTAAPVVAFEETSGSTGGAKLIPYTAQSLLDFRAAVLPWLAALARCHPAITRGPAYLAISPAMRQPRVSAAGIPIGLGSDAAYLGSDLAPAMMSLLAVTPSVAGITDVAKWRSETLVQLVECADLAFISVWSPTFLSGLLNALSASCESIARKVSNTARQRLEAAFAGPVPAFARLWPDLACISCWMDGASAPFSRDLQTLLPHLPFEAKGLLATEAAVTTPIDLGAGVIHAVPAIRSGFFDFIDTAGNVHGLADLVEGETYRCLVTTSGGLYRYDLGDRLTCTGWCDEAGIRTPVLRFAGRERVSDLVGEKLSEAFVAPILNRLPVRAALRPVRVPVAGYELVFEVAPGVSPPEEPILDLVEKALHANVHYAYARRLGQLELLRAVQVPCLSDLFASDPVPLAMIKPKAILV